MASDSAFAATSRRISRRSFSASASSVFTATGYAVGASPTATRVLVGWSTDINNVNGPKTYGGIVFGKPSYNAGDFSMFWDNPGWKITNNNNLLWSSEEDVATPELVAVWAPVPFNGAAGTITVS